MSKITTLVIDDERLARQVVRDLLEQDPEIQVTGEAADGEEALDLIEKLQPQLVFLDIHMPILSGLQLLQRLKPAQRPIVVFVTSYDEHAIAAFELHAVDYLVKPFQDSRFRQALDRVKYRLRDQNLRVAEKTLSALLDQLQGSAPAPAVEKPTPFVLKADGEHHFIEQADIRWVEAQGDYIRVHTTKRNLLARLTLTRALEQLDPGRFVRVHKSCVVNADYVRRLKPTTAWGRPLELDDGTVLNISRSYRNAFERFL